MAATGPTGIGQADLALADRDGVEHAPPDPVARAFAAEERRSVRIGVWLRLVGCVVISAWLLIENPWPAGPFYIPFVFIVFINGLAHDWMLRRGRAGTIWRLCHPAIDAAVVVGSILAPNPFYDIQAPEAMRLGSNNVVYIYLVSALSVFTYSPRLVIWSAVAASALWSLGHFYVVTLPETLPVLSEAEFDAMDRASLFRYVSDPHFLSYGNLAKAVIMLWLQAAALAAAVYRARKLAYQQASAAHERANLARYFPPSVVDDLARAARPISSARTQEVAVLFADIVDFTALSERLSPERLIGLLREIQGRLANAVFNHRGTLEKFTGDGVMATFGTPTPGPGDAAQALACAAAMVQAVEDWNEHARPADQPPVKIGIGVHYGPVVVGNIGDENRLEYAVVGDSVNVASRLERLTRTLGVSIAASDQVIARARREHADGVAIAGRFHTIAAQPIRGRAEPIEIWTLAAAADGEA